MLNVVNFVLFQGVMKTTNAKNNEATDFGVSALKTEIAERIRVAIRESGGNSKISRETGIGLKTVSNYTAGNTEPKIVALSQIARACRVSLDWLATGREPKQPVNPATALDMEVLEASYEIAEEMFTNKGFTPEHKAKILKIIYEKGLEEKGKDL